MMAHTRRTLILSKKWDLQTTMSGGVEVGSGEMATAQAVANEARLFTNDAYFQQDQGIPHYIIDLGEKANTSVLRSYLRKAALRVPDVLEVLSVDIVGIDPKTRTLTGDIRFRTIGGEQRSQIMTYF